MVPEWEVEEVGGTRADALANAVTRCLSEGRVECDWRASLLSGGRRQTEALEVDKHAEGKEWTLGLVSSGPKLVLAEEFLGCGHRRRRAQVLGGQNVVGCCGA